jgi:hypothetical protein
MSQFPTSSSGSAQRLVQISLGLQSEAGELQIGPPDLAG